MLLDLLLGIIILSCGLAAALWLVVAALYGAVLFQFVLRCTTRLYKGKAS